MTRLSRQSLKRADWVLRATLRSCEGTRRERRTPVARTDEACEMIILTWNDLRLDVAWELGPKAVSAAH